MNKKISNKDIVRNYLYLLIPLVLFSCYKNGYILYSKNLVTLLYVFKPLIMFVSAIVAAYGLELLWTVIKKEDIGAYLNNSYLPLYAGLLSLVVPVNIEPLLYILLLGVILLISKLKFLSLNPVALGRILFVLGALLIGKYTYLNVYEENVLVSYDLWDIILGKSIGGSGATSIFILLIIFFILVNKNYYKKEIALSSLTSFLIPVVTLCLISKDYSKLNIIVDSEIFFASILIAPLLTKSPYTKVGKITYGLLIGFIGFILCHTLTIKEGLYIIILIVSIFSKYFDLIESKLPKRRVKI